jgi:hypothetical protein
VLQYQLFGKRIYNFKNLNIVGLMMLPAQLLALGPVIAFSQHLRSPIAALYSLPFSLTTYAYVLYSPLLPTWVSYIGFAAECAFMLHFSIIDDQHSLLKTLIPTTIATIIKLCFLTVALTVHPNALMICAWILAIAVTGPDFYRAVSQKEPVKDAVAKNPKKPAPISLSTFL